MARGGEGYGRGSVYTGSAGARLGGGRNSAAAGGSKAQVAARVKPKGKIVTMTSGNEKSMSYTKKIAGVGKMRQEARPSGRVVMVKDVPAKRRLGTIGQAVGRVKAKANKEIKIERKISADRVYDKTTYGYKTVNARKPKSPMKPKGKK